MTRKKRFFRLSLVVFLALAHIRGNSAAHAAPTGALLARLKEAKGQIENEDFLGFRVLIQKLKSFKLTFTQWAVIQNMILPKTDQVGYDLAYYWNRRSPLPPSAMANRLETADQLMLSEKFEQAFKMYQDIANQIKTLQAKPKRGSAIVQNLVAVTLDRLYPQTLHSMARALYGAGRLKEALNLYQWFGSGYPAFRQILFEKMWAAFKLGKVDIAIGSIASQHSVYFSEYLTPESYLIQTYLYRKLCRTDDLNEVVNEIREWEAILIKGGGIEFWAKADPITLSLWKLTRIKKEFTTPSVSTTEREMERKRIETKLTAYFEGQRKKILAELKTATAYVFLAEGKTSQSLLEPITKLPSRSAYFKLNLEIWPVLDTEEWVDELGYRRFFGESLCKKAASL